MCSLPTVATSFASSFAALPPPPPPQPAASSPSTAAARRAGATRRACKEPRTFIRGRLFALRGLAGGQHSIDQFDRPLELLLAQRHLTPRRGVDGGVDPPAQLAQLGAPHPDRPDRRAPAAEDEVVGAEPRELQL